MNEIWEFYFYETALYFAVENSNVEMVSILLNNDKLDVNILYILIHFFNVI